MTRLLTSMFCRSAATKASSASSISSEPSRFGISRPPLFIEIEDSRNPGLPYRRCMALREQEISGETAEAWYPPAAESVRAARRFVSDVLREHSAEPHDAALL